VVLVTAHDEFSQLDPDRLVDNGVSVVVDGRNLLSPPEFEASELFYTGVGR
jgi:UDP-N-acetyl-D-mannosaminuronate dehydrogenase